MRMRQNYYFNAIRDVDQQIVQLLDQLDRLSLAENTIIIFTSDHGELLGCHGGLSGKGTTTYRQQNHVPMLVVHPAIKGGQRCLETTSHLDFVPTIVSLTGKSTAPVADVMTRMKGQDFSPLLRQPVNPEFTQRRGGVLFCYSQLMVHDPQFTKTLYETLQNKSIARSALFRTIEIVPGQLAAARLHPVDRRRALQVQPLLLVPRLQHAGDTGRTAREQRSRALRPAQRPRRDREPRLRLRPQPRPRSPR